MPHLIDAGESRLHSTSYRKYGIAIPNKYAVEEALRSKQAGKRDGTPMAAATNKKTKVSALRCTGAAYSL
jgi:hypothetical protein